MFRWSRAACGKADDYSQIDRSIVQSLFGKVRETRLSTHQTRSFTGHDLLLMIIAFFGIFVYGLLAALPGSVLPTLERNQYLPSDSAAGTFLLINAIGAVLAYAVSGPIIDRI